MRGEFEISRRIGLWSEESSLRLWICVGRVVVLERCRVRQVCVVGKLGSGLGCRVQIHSSRIVVSGQIELYQRC